jgi:hypothetical protein
VFIFLPNKSPKGKKLLIKRVIRTSKKITKHSSGRDGLASLPFLFFFDFFFVADDYERKSKFHVQTLPENALKENPTISLLNRPFI